MIHITPLIDTYSKDQLSEIVSNSLSLAEVIITLGYNTNHGSNYNTVKKRLKEYGISTDHFRYKGTPRRTSDDVFCINSTVSQNALRNWYKKISDDSICKICGQSILWNGRKLTMILDHINGDNHDNRPGNLRWICPNCNSQLDTFAGRNINKCKHHTTPRRNDEQCLIEVDERHSVEVVESIPETKRKIKKGRIKKLCPVCGSNHMSENSKMCKSCRQKENRKLWASREDLEKLIYNVPMVEIGKMYGVSDNAIRKWCKAYDLPFKLKDLHTAP